MRQRKKLSSRSYNSIDIDHFMTDIQLLPLHSSLSSTIDEIFSQYNIGVKSILDIHAPLLTSEITIRSDNPWMTEEIRSSRRANRKLERRDRKTRLEVDKQILHDSQRKLKCLITAAKIYFLSNKVNENVGRISLYRIVDSFLQ